MFKRKWWISAILLVLLTSCESSVSDTKQSNSSPKSDLTNNYEQVENGNKTSPRRENQVFKDGNAENDERFEPMIEFTQNGNQSHFTFKIINKSSNMFTFHFNTTQQFDYVILNQNGDVVRKYSENQEFKSIRSSLPVQPNSAAVYEVTEKDLPKGKYQIIFNMMAKEMKMTSKLDFEIK